MTPSPPPAVRRRGALTAAVFAALLTGHGAPGRADQFRISDMGGTGESTRDAHDAAVAYNSQDDQYLVVWWGDEVTGIGGMVDDEFEIFGQRLSATGLELTPNDFRISDMGGTADTAYYAYGPAVAYNSQDSEYLVVWYGSDDVGGLESGEYEIFGQRLSATGIPLGANDFRISDMGGTGNLLYAAYGPAVAYNSQDNEYLVVWYGSDNVGGLVIGEFEIFGQRLSATGAHVGANDFRISDAGGTGDPSYDAYNPAVAYSATHDRYLVVWRGDDNIAGFVDGEDEVFGRWVAADGDLIENDFWISDMGGVGDPAYDVWNPAVAYNGDADEFLVVWMGDDDQGGLADDEFEVFGQRLDGATLFETGANDFRISDAGGTGDPNYAASEPAVAYNGADGGYLVVWRGDDDVGGLVEEEFEVFGQLLDAAGAAFGPNDFRISRMGGTGDPAFMAWTPAVASSGAARRFLAAWHGDDDTGGLLNGENEIFGAVVDVMLFADGFESGDASAWSSAVP